MKINESEIIDYTAENYSLSNISSTISSLLLSGSLSSLSDTEVHPADNNKTNTSNEEFVPYENRPETYLVPILFSIIFIVGVLGNGTLIVVFIKHRAMRNVPNT